MYSSKDAGLTGQSTLRAGICPIDAFLRDAVFKPSLSTSLVLRRHLSTVQGVALSHFCFMLERIITIPKRHPHMLSNKQSAANKLFIAPSILMVSILGACSGESVDQSSEAFSAMADVHNDPNIIKGTAEIDRLLIDQDPDGNWSASVFEPDTVLLESDENAGKQDENASAVSPGDRSPFYGDLHVHTEYSFDGYAMGTQATPYDAYRFAKGEAITQPGRF